EQIAILVAVSTLSVVAIAFLLFLVVRKLSQQHRASQQRLTLEKQRLDTAVNNMTQGLLLFDASQRLVICNQRYIEMYGLSAAVLSIDIDEFKSVNDSLGHLIGDELLKSVAASLNACAQETDFVARLGGDEFAIVQTSVRNRTEVVDLVTRIFETIRAPYECLG